MKKNILLAVFVCIQTLSGIAQSNPLDKKMEKVYNLVEKAKYKDASEYLEKILENNPEYGKGWDYLSKLRYKEYKDAKATDGIFSGNITVTTKEKGKDKKVENDSLANALMELLSKYSPSKIAYSKYIYTFRQALLTSEDAYQSSAILRSLFIDTPTDTAVSKKALKYYNDAESEFAKKNYENAAKLYKRATEEQPDRRLGRVQRGGPGSVRDEEPLPEQLLHHAAGADPRRSAADSDDRGVPRPGHQGIPQEDRPVLPGQAEVRSG